MLVNTLELFICRFITNRMHASYTCCRVFLKMDIVSSSVFKNNSVQATLKMSPVKAVKTCQTLIVGNQPKIWKPKREHHVNMQKLSFPHPLLVIKVFRNLHFYQSFLKELVSGTETLVYVWTISTSVLINTCLHVYRVLVLVLRSPFICHCAFLMGGEQSRTMIKMNKS